MDKLFILAQILRKDDTTLPDIPAGPTTWNTILSIAFVIIGAVAVLFMVIAGVRYITSQGDPAKSASAKNQILYSAIGLIIAVLAGAIVNYVLGRT